MRIRSLALLCGWSLSTAGCIIPEDAVPTVQADAKFASAFVFRGQTNVDNPVIQPTARVSLPTSFDGFIQGSVFGNVDLKNDTGRAWFPNGHAGKFTQVDLGLAVGKTFDWEEAGLGVTVTAGVETYILPNGQEFPFGERGNTSEIVLAAEFDVLEANPYVVYHYDFDEVRGSYFRFGIRESFPLSMFSDQLERLSLTLDGSIAYASSAQSSWLYGLDQAGFADLRGSILLNYEYDDRTTISAGLHGSSIVDSTLDDWFSTLNSSQPAFGAPGPIRDDVIWGSLNFSWVF